MSITAKKLEASADQQNFLVPLVLNYSTVDAMTINQHLDTLAAVGLELESFGQNSFILRSHPTWFKRGARRRHGRRND